MSKDNEEQTKEQQEQQEQPALSEEQKEMLAEAMYALGDAIENIEKAGRISRPLSLALTRAEESDMWLQRGLEDLGYRAKYADDDEGGDDEGEQDESE